MVSWYMVVAWSCLALLAHVLPSWDSVCTKKWGSTHTYTHTKLASISSPKTRFDYLFLQWPKYYCGHSRSRAWENRTWITDKFFKMYRKVDYYIIACMYHYRLSYSTYNKKQTDRLNCYMYVNKTLCEVHKLYENFYNARN